MRYFNQLIKAVQEEDFYKTNEILSIIIQQDDSINYVKKILEFMENNPDIDYGMPGPLVHYMERECMSDYDDLLYESVSRKPTILTLWMLNRVINSLELVDKKKYISLLEKISEDVNQTDIIKSEANFYLQYQKNRECK